MSLVFGLIGKWEKNEEDDESFALDFSDPDNPRGGEIIFGKIVSFAQCTDEVFLWI